MTLHAVRRLPRALAAAAGLACAAAPVPAQELPEFNKLRSPTAPAFVILGVAPAQIERPTRPGAFAASLLQRAEDALRGGGLPASYAVELAPYWLVPHPRLTFADYARGGWRTAVRDAALSFAVTDSAGGGDTGAPAGEAGFRRVGLGLRTTLRPGRLAAPATGCVDAVSREATRLSGPVGLAVATDPAITRLRGELPAKADSVALLARRIADQVVAVEGERLTKLARSCTEILSARAGFAIDAAVGAAVAFPGGRARAGDVEGLGVWLTPAWLGASFSHVGVLRLALDDDADGGRAVRRYDLGVRSIYAWARFAASVEAVYRHVDRGAGAGDFTRLAAIVDAKLGDGTWLSTTVGRDFDPARPNSLLALFGLRWQLGEQRVRPDVPIP